MSASTRSLLLLCFLFPASAALAETSFSISPTAGPVSGGTLVTIKGDFGQWPYGVLFGGVAARETTRVDEHTLTAITPAHLPGPSHVRIFEYDIFIGTDLTYEFEGHAEHSSLQRLLLPVFTPPVKGAFGSEFRTQLSLTSTGPRNAQVFGLEDLCPIENCTRYPQHDYPLEVTTNTSLPVPSGNPGRFVYTSVEDLDLLAGNLRVFDVTRSASNYGTEIPIVRQDDFDNTRIDLVGIPTDPRFRNTLRIYGDEVRTVYVTVSGRPSVLVTLTPGEDIFSPTYGVFTDFPIGPGMVNVTIESPIPPTSPPTFFEIWAFVSVTNNDTQLISTITPQP
jgi:hypothetical protein